MRTATTYWLPALVAGLALMGHASATDVLHARVSFEAGGAMVKGQEDADWSFATINTLVLPGDVLWADSSATLETEFSGGTFLRMADGSRAEVVSVPPDGIIRGWTGSFYIQRISRSTGSFVFRTPACDVLIENDSHVRVDIVGDGSTTVTVRWGRARVHTDLGEPVLVTEGRRSYCDVGYLPSPAVRFNRNESDAFDEWSRERAELLARGADTVPKEIISTSAPIGVHELAPYGDWVTVSGRPYWRPTVVTNYVPYRQGHWSYVPAYGYCWVGTYSFSYVTSHYGRWSYHDRYGWIWTYVPGWGPAWVSTVRYGDYYVWTPLDYYNRPVSYGSAYFRVGDIRFSIHSSSYCYAPGLYYGPVVTYPVTHTVVHGISTGNVYIWNIYASNYSRRYGGLPGYSRPIHHGPASLLRDYSPRRVIRGPDTVTGSSVFAGTRAVQLEQSLSQQAFRSAGVTGSRGIRTAFNETSRSANIRAAQVEPETLNQVRQARSIRDTGSAVASVRQATPLRGSTVSEERTGAESRTIRGIGAQARGVEAPAARDDSRTTTRSIGQDGTSRGPAQAPSQSDVTRQRAVRTDTPEPGTATTRQAPLTRSATDSARTATPDQRGATQRSVDAQPRVTTPPQRSAAPITRIETTPTPRDATPRSAGGDRSVTRSATPPQQTPAPRSAQTREWSSDRAPVTTTVPRTSTPSREAPSVNRTPASTQRSVTPQRTPVQQSPSVQLSAPPTQQSSSVQRSAPPTQQSPSVQRSAPPVQRSLTPQSNAPSTRSVAPQSAPRSTSVTTTRPAPQAQAPRSSSPAPASRVTRIESPAPRSAAPAPQQRQVAPQTRSAPRSVAPQPQAQTRSYSPPAQSVAPAPRSLAPAPAPNVRSVSPSPNVRSVSPAPAPSRGSFTPRSTGNASPRTGRGG